MAHAITRGGYDWQYHANPGVRRPPIDWRGSALEELHQPRNAYNNKCHGRRCYNLLNWPGLSDLYYTFVPAAVRVTLFGHTFDQRTVDMLASHLSRSFHEVSCPKPMPATNHARAPPDLTARRTSPAQEVAHIGNCRKLCCTNCSLTARAVP